MAHTALLLAILHSCGASHELDDRPNILFFLIDDLGFNDLGFSQQLNIGKAATRTPSIDKLARSGLVLGNYYVDTVCSPTRATIMTDRYPIHNTINQWIHSGVGEAVGLPLNETTVADLLNASGYICHAIGKWHLVRGIVVCGTLMVAIYEFVPGC
jgi:arylsulfatase A-like enzyme